MHVVFRIWWKTNPDGLVKLTEKFVFSTINLSFTSSINLLFYHGLCHMDKKKTEHNQGKLYACLSSLINNYTLSNNFEWAEE